VAGEGGSGPRKWLYEDAKYSTILVYAGPTAAQGLNNTRKNGPGGKCNEKERIGGGGRDGPVGRHFV